MASRHQAKRAIFAMALFTSILPASRAQTMVAAPAPAMAPESETAGEWSFHAQSTYIDQWHYHFPAAYSGANSLTNASESERTFSFSLFLGRKLWAGAELYFNPEIFQGSGLSRTLGAAGFPNGEAVKAGFANLHYNTSRLFIRQVVGLGGGKEKLEADENQFPEEVDADRLVFSAGKFAASDFFDDNSFSHNSRTQFLNWALWESAAWDYPADVVGYTAGAVAEWQRPGGILRYGIFMMPTEANGARLDHHLEQAYGQILQYDFQYSLGGERKGTVRPFVYWNRGHMGLYSAADAQADPDIASTRAYRSKEGAGLSWDQALSANLGAFVRLSWDDGRTESFSFDEIDRSAAAGLSFQGKAWSRPDDTLGLAGVVNGIAPDHRTYLAEGGLGLILGDGTLHYGPEQDLEIYYSVQVVKWLRISPDWQYLERPGYNRDRGGVAIYSVRAHIEF